jgi:zinc and cadmium transporter
MSELAWLALYSLLILLMSLFGGCLPFLGRVTHGRLQLYLSASAGVMLGAAFFHVMPDALEISGPLFGWWMSLAVVGLFCIERFIAPHSHELDHECGDHDHHHHEPDEKAADLHHHHHHDKHAVEAGDKAADERRSAAPALAGWMAVAGLTVHTFMNGVGLAGAVQFDMGNLANAIPGLALFLAIVLHKPADALAISMVLSRKGSSPRRIALVQLGFALMVPAGAAAFALTSGAIEENLRGQLTGAALAFSAGTFLFIALSDLLPEVQFHRHDRVPLFGALVAGVVLMGGIALLEGHDHDHEAKGNGTHAAAQKDEG